MFIVYGKKKFFIRIFEPLFYKCPYCDSENSTEVFIYSRYFHIFWIPVFPIRKVAVAKCTECDTLRPEERFGPKLTEHLKEELKNIKHPFYSWTLLILLCLLILLIIFVVPKK
jgi:hypothetical protein